MQRELLVAMRMRAKRWILRAFPEMAYRYPLAFAIVRRSARSIPVVRAAFLPFTLNMGLARFRCFGYRRVMTAQQESAPEAKNTIHSNLLMSLNTESEQDPQTSSNIRAIYHNSSLKSKHRAMCVTVPGDSIVAWWR